LREPISKKPITKIGLVEWLKVQGLNSSTTERKKEGRKGRKEGKERKKMTEKTETKETKAF
jgi:hypothetical protein